jgi:hydroxymethylpyrimidine pyrophosphatase-like HAD family hydrolase
VSKYPITRTLAVDVDGTLLRHGELYKPVLDRVIKARQDGARTMLWSARGADYAKKVANLLNVTEHFDDIVSKPGFIIDDLGWGWIKYTRVLRLLDDEEPI